MSKVQGDGYKTWTNKGLNEYYSNVYRPKYLEMENRQIKEYYINGGKIICEQRNIVAEDGWKLKGLKLTGKKEYIVRVYADEKSDWANATEFFEDATEANEYYKFWKMQLEM